MSDDQKVPSKDHLLLFEKLHRACNIEYDKQLAEYLVSNLLAKGTKKFESSGQCTLEEFDSIVPPKDWVQNGGKWKDKLMDQVTLNMSV